MKYFFETFCCLFIFTLIIVSCSTQKNKFLNRQYHGINTKYNVLFNGNQALSVGEQIINATIEDDFFKIIKTDPILLKGEDFDANTIVPGFQKAEEKAVKAIQKHSMNIKGNQENKYIDEAYLLLGKARYYDRRFFPAIEAFNFLLDNNTDESVYIEGRIWREKTNIRLQNNQIAINNLRPLATKLINKNFFYGMANATLAQAFINLKYIDSASQYIVRAANYEKNLERKVRYTFITAQLLEIKGSKDLAQFYYNKIVILNWQVSRKFWINAKINSLRLLHEKDSSLFVKPVQELLKVYENKMFSHTLNRAIGVHYLSKKEDSLGKVYLIRSNKSKGIDNPTQKINYRDLADVSFKNKKYLLTGSYLDSLLLIMPEKSITKIKTQRERDNLSDIIFFENQFKNSDSLLKLLSLNESEQKRFFQKFLFDKRKNEIKKTENLKSSKKNNFFSKKNSLPAFYFYNPNLVIRGQQIYASTWGKRPNIDNWRNKTQVQFKSRTVKTDELNKTLSVSDIEVESVGFYMNRIQKSPEIIDSLIQKNHQAALKLGLIYKEKYKDKRLSIKNLKYLIDKNASTVFLTPALYHLYKIHLEDSNNISNKYKNQLIDKFPESIYSRVLLDPENYILGELKTPKSIYLKILNKYLEDSFNEALSMIEDKEILIVATKWEPKLMLLKAQIMGRVKGKKVWKNQLTEIIKDYPSSKASIKAKKDLENIDINFKTKTKTLAKFKWVMPYKVKTKFDFNQLIDSLELNIISHKAKKLKLTNDIYNDVYRFVIIHGFSSKTEIDSIKKKLPITTLKLIDSNNFVALSSRFRKLFIEKTWSEKKF